MKKREVSWVHVTSYGVFLAVLLCCSGCASFGAKMKAFLGGKSSSGAVQQNQAAKPVTFSEKPYHMSGARRKYQRVTKESLQDQSHLDSTAGSLWVNEGQGAYLFSQNIMRMIGDPVGVMIEGEPKQQLSSKVDVIKKLLDKLEARRQAALRAPAGEKAEGAEKAEGEEGAEKPGAPNPAAAANKPKPPTPSEPEFNVKKVPTRIVERMVDGNYRIKGSQPIMIGNHEYKVIVTGIVRAEDFNDEGISATQLLDPKFDIVSPRRKEN